MANLFSFILNMSIAGAVTALIVILFRAVGKRKLPANLFYILWAIVLIKLVVPVSFPSSVSIYNLATNNKTNYTVHSVPVGDRVTQIQFMPLTNPQTVQKDETPLVSNVDKLNDTENINSVSTSPEQPSQKIAPFAVLGIIWLLGAGGMLLYGAAGLWAIHRRIRKATLTDMSDLLVNLPADIKQPRRIKLYTADCFDTPVVCGIFRPVVFLPSSHTLSQEQLQFVLRHEFTHIKRYDNLFKFIFYVVLCIHRFNPVVWMTVKLFEEDMERSCDEKVIQKIGISHQKEYATALLKFAMNSSSLLSPVSFGESNVKSRIKSILRIKKATALIVILSIVILSGLAVVLLTNAKREPVGNLTGTSSIQTSTAADRNEKVITDPEKLTWLWDSYIYDSIATIANFEFTMPNTGVQTKSSFEMFVLYHMADQQNPTGQMQEIDLNLPTLAVMKQELIRYFNTDFALTQEEYNHIYDVQAGDKEKGILKFYLNHQSYLSISSYNCKFNQVTYNQKNNTYTYQLDFMGSMETGRVSETKIFTLTQRPNGELYFKSLNFAYPNVKLVSIHGGFTALPTFFAEGTALDDHRMLLKSTSQTPTVPATTVNGIKQMITHTTFTIFDTNTNQMIKTYDIADTPTKKFMSIRITPDKFIFKFTDSFFCTDKEFNKLANMDIKLPGFITNLNNKYADVGYNIYDVSNDLNTIVFTDSVGLYSYSRKTGEPTLIHKHSYQNKLIQDIPKSEIRNPRFSLNDQYLISDLCGYESLVGTLISAKTSDGFTNVFWNGQSPTRHNWTNVTLFIPSLIWGKDDGNESREFKFIDLDSESSARQVKLVLSTEKTITYLDDMVHTYVPDYDYQNTINNENYFVYMAQQKEDTIDAANSQVNIVVVNRKTMKAKTVLTITAGTPNLCAVTNDGRVILSYYFEHESGCIMTDAPSLD